MDFLGHRELITHLYQDRGMTLDEVMYVLKAYHGFKATYKKQYKYRLKQWGVRKNLRLSDVETYVSHGPESVGANSMLTIRGQKVSIEQIEDYAKRKKITLPRLVMQNTARIASFHRPALLPPLRSTDEMRLIEKCIHASRSFVAGNLDVGTWIVGSSGRLNETKVGTEWSEMMSSATTLVSLGRVNEAFRLFRKCNVKYEQLLIANEPRLFDYTYLTLLRLCDRWPELVWSILRQIHALSRIAYEDTKYPIVTFLSSLQELGPAKLRETGAVLSHGLLTSFQDHLPTGAHFLVEMSAEASHVLVSSGVIDSSSAIHDLTAQLTNIDISLAGSHSLICWVKSRIAFMYFKGDDIPKALRFIEEVLSGADRGSTDPQDMFTFARCYVLMFFIHCKLGDEAAAVSAGRILIDHCIDSYGMGHDYTITALAIFGDYLSSRGYSEAAAAVQRGLNNAIDELVGD